MGLFASYLYPSFYTRSDVNTWKLKGTIGQYIELAVIDLDIEIEYNIDSFIEIFDISLEGAKSSLGRLYRKGIGSTHYKSSWHMMDIEFRVGNNLSGRGFFGRYKIIDVVSNMNQYVSSGKFRKLGNIPECKLIDWLIDYCFAPSKQYFSYFQDENKTNNIYNPEGAVVVVIV